jgi:hypothetical protein
LDSLEEQQDFKDVTAFVLCVDTGTPPAIGTTLTFREDNRTEESLVARLAALEGQARNLQNELVVRGVIGGVTMSFLFQPTTETYTGDAASGEALSRGEVLELLHGDDAITFAAVVPGQGAQLGVDRNENGVKDRDEPSPTLTIQPLGAAQLRLAWQRGARGWRIESAPTPQGRWAALPRAPRAAGALLESDLAFPDERSFFYRLRRTW